MLDAFAFAHGSRRHDVREARRSRRVRHDNEIPTRLIGSIEFSATEPALVRDHNEYRPRPEDHAVGLCWSRVVTSDVIQVVVVPKQLLDTLHGSTQSAYCIAIRDHCERPSSTTATPASPSVPFAVRPCAIRARSVRDRRRHQDHWWVVVVTEICIASWTFNLFGDVPGTPRIALSRRKHGFESRWGYFARAAAKDQPVP